MQTETVAANGSASGYPVGRYRVPALGDLSFNAPVASTAVLVFSTDWSAVWDATPAELSARSRFSAAGPRLW